MSSVSHQLKQRDKHKWRARFYINFGIEPLVSRQSQSPFWCVSACASPCHTHRCAAAANVFVPLFFVCCGTVKKPCAPLNELHTFGTVSRIPIQCVRSMALNRFVEFKNHYRKLSSYSKMPSLFYSIQQTNWYFFCHFNFANNFLCLYFFVYFCLFVVNTKYWAHSKLSVYESIVKPS